MVDSALNGAHGHLGLAMPDPAFTNRTGMPFVEIATDPRPYDLTIGLNTGSVVKGWCEAQHQERQDAYNIQQ
eukprot:6944860-Ditylum_brightwellii.AAC.1